MKVAASVFGVVLSALSGTLTSAQDSSSNYYSNVVNDWTLLTVTHDNGETKCVVGTASRDGQLRTSYITKFDLLIDIRINNLDLEDGVYRLALQVDRRSPVRFERTLVDKGRILIRVESRPENLLLVSDIITGNELFVLSNLMNPAAVFSLHGSTAALTWLRDCNKE